MPDLEKPYYADLIAFTEPTAERLEFVERDGFTVMAEESLDGFFQLMRDEDGDLVGFCLHGDPFRWSAFQKYYDETR